MPPVRGVVLETFGAGNAPQRADMVQSFKEACDRGVVIVAISQCTKGSVSDSYETGRTLMQAGVVPGGDMTPEARYFLNRSPRLTTELFYTSVRSLS
jgi:lysophospholipase